MLHLQFCSQIYFSSPQLNNENVALQPNIGLPESAAEVQLKRCGTVIVDLQN
jgi:hypothetical protein